MSANRNIDQGAGDDGSTAVALACIELPMLRLDELLPVPTIVDPTFGHVEACIELVVSRSGERDPHAVGTK